MVGLYYGQKEVKRKRSLKKRVLEGIVLRWRLWKACKVLGIRPYKFQREFAIKGYCKWPEGRRNGKTMAVALYGIVRGVKKPKDVYALARRDPDMWATTMMRDTFAQEYRKLVKKLEEQEP